MMEIALKENPFGHGPALLDFHSGDFRACGQSRPPRAPIVLRSAFCNTADERGNPFLSPGVSSRLFDASSVLSDPLSSGGVRNGVHRPIRNRDLPGQRRHPRDVERPCSVYRSAMELNRGATPVAGPPMSSGTPSVCSSVNQKFDAAIRACPIAALRPRAARQNALAVAARVEPGRVEAEVQRQRDLDAALARACRRSRLGRRDCSSNHGEAVRPVFGPLCAQGSPRRPELPVTALIEMSPIGVPI